MSLITRINRRVSYDVKQLHKYASWKTSDFYFVSFPKCGRTWIRVLLAKYFSLHYKTPNDDTFNTLFRQNRNVPKIFFTHRGLHGGIIHKSRKGYVSVDQIKKKNIPDLKGKKVIFLARDPRDTVISHYFSVTKRASNAKLAAVTANLEIPEFIRHPDFGIEHIIDYMNAWYGGRDTFSSFHLIRYEDCKRDTFATIAQLLQFFGLNDIKKDLLQEAIDFSSFDNMRKMEQEGSRGTRLKAADASDKESYKTRKGKVGGFEDYLSQEDVVFVNQALQKLHPDFGYSSQ